MNSARHIGVVTILERKDAIQKLHFSVEFDISKTFERI